MQLQKRRILLFIVRIDLILKYIYNLVINLCFVIYRASNIKYSYSFRIEMSSSNKKQLSGTLNTIQTPLIAIPQAQIQIYPKHILLLFTEAPKQSNTLSTIPSLTQDIQKTEQQFEKKRIISLNDQDLVFNIFQEQKTVQIINIVGNKTIISFKVSQIGTLLTVQSILRSKMCELGFQRRYSIMNKIGRGASADVYLIERISDGKMFAVKVIALKNSNVKAYETFINEVKLLRVLKHNHIVKLESVYYSKKSLYQVLQYLNGGTLLTQLRQSAIKTKQEKWRAVAHITQAVQYMRQKRVVHRDLKLQNILIRKNQDGTKDYVVSDFGLGSWLNQTNPLFERCGTPGYIAPEILRGGKGSCIIKSETDIFSLGILAHFIFLGKSLFKYTGDTRALLFLNKQAKFDFNDCTYSGLTVSQLSFLKLTLQVDPERRAKSYQLIERFSQKIQQQQGSQKKIRISFPSPSQQRASQRTQLKTSVREAPNSERKIQSKQTRQKIMSNSLEKIFKKIKDKDFSIKKQEQKPKTERSIIDSIFERISFKSTQQNKSLKKKREASLKKVDMKDFLTN